MCTALEAHCPGSQGSAYICLSSSVVHVDITGAQEICAVCVRVVLILGASRCAAMVDTRPCARCLFQTRHGGIRQAEAPYAIRMVEIVRNVEHRAAAILALRLTLPIWIQSSHLFHGQEVRRCIFWTRSTICVNNRLWCGSLVNLRSSSMALGCLLLPAQQAAIIFQVRSRGDFGSGLATSLWASGQGPCLKQGHTHSHHHRKLPSHGPYRRVLRALSRNVLRIQYGASGVCLQMERLALQEACSTRAARS
mmetsp:Transcript_109541/g.194261  ORF Transcript_109541/g.194261 Transcript_109541/m.194261 type:complete len:251 (+) Transcript_109541:50-802(+)